jgi:hypothetical protein
VKNALAEYVERRLSSPKDGDPPLRPYQLSEGSRQRLIAVMKEMKATAISPAQECEQVSDGFCRVRMHCRENVLNATNVPTTYMLVLEERAGTLDPVQLLSQFDKAEPDQTTGIIQRGLLFEYLRSKDVEAKLQQMEE